MFIRSQDKEKLINVDAVTDVIYARNIRLWFEGKPEGNYVCTTLVSGNTIIIASYDTRNKCLETIERIMCYVANYEYGDPVLDLSSEISEI